MHQKSGSGSTDPHPDEPLAVELCSSLWWLLDEEQQAQYPAGLPISEAKEFVQDLRPHASTPELRRRIGDLDELLDRYPSFSIAERRSMLPLLKVQADELKRQFEAVPQPKTQQSSDTRRDTVKSWIIGIGFIALVIAGLAIFRGSDDHEGERCVDYVEEESRWGEVSQRCVDWEPIEANVQEDPPDVDVPSSRQTSAGGVDCSDFPTQGEAQRFFNTTVGDPYLLDEDNDGFACEWLP